ncbi:hypothetical protein C8R43DRAFT_268400 [Mycena crocata]|nr:hypothetical protein C8R43DRAFT_268400 [Mycena crocata]
MLSRLVQVDPDLPYILEALRAGLILAIFRCRIDNMGGSGKHPLAGILPTTLRQLSGYLIFCSVLLSQVDRALETIGMDLTPLLHTGIWTAWSDFNRRATERLALKVQFDSQKSMSRKFCDNMQCNRMSSKSDFQRCTQCRSRYYCSLSCQITDWELGGHKKLCRKLGVPTSGDDEFELSSKNKAFMRFLLDRDYQKQKRHILMLKSTLLHQYTEPVYHEFDYSSGDLKVNVRRVVDLPALIPCGTGLRAKMAQARWADHIDRLGSNPGCVQFTVVLVPAGYLIFPLRSNSSKLWDGLSELVDILSQGGLEPDEYGERIRVLSEEDGDEVVELH